MVGRMKRDEVAHELKTMNVNIAGLVLNYQLLNQRMTRIENRLFPEAPAPAPRVARRRRRPSPR
jgi:hypothetical protein